MFVEILIRREAEGEVIFTIETVPANVDLKELQSPRHLEKGLRASPYQKDNFRHRE